MAKIKINSKSFMVAFTIFVMTSSILGVYVFQDSFTGSATEEVPLQPGAAYPDTFGLNSFLVGDYTFYEVEDGTFGAFLPTTTGELWPIKFRLDPREAEGIEVSNESTEKIYTSDKVYVTYNPNVDEVSKVAIAAIEISRVIPLITGLAITEAFTEDANPINPDIPLKTCDDATETTAVIQLEISDVNEVIREGECVIVKGTNPDDLILSADKFGMHLVGLKV